mgnify:FL=1
MYNGIGHSNQVQGIHPWLLGLKCRFSIVQGKTYRNDYELAKIQRNEFESKYRAMQKQQDKNDKQSDSKVYATSSNDTLVVNMLQLLCRIKCEEKPIRRALREYEKLPESTYKRSKEGGYRALKDYPSVYNEFCEIVKRNRRRIENALPSEVAELFKREIEQPPYWRTRETSDYTYDFLDIEIGRVLDLINEYLAPSSSMKLSEFRKKFLELTEVFLGDE